LQEFTTAVANAVKEIPVQVTRKT